jgi:energy-converting hydrogenase Eha subunit E
VVFGLQFIAWAYATLVNPVELESSDLSTTYFQLLTAIPETMWLIGFSTCNPTLISPATHLLSNVICMWLVIEHSIYGMAYIMVKSITTMLLLSASRSTTEKRILCMVISMDIIITCICVNSNCINWCCYYIISFGVTIIFLCYFAYLPWIHVYCVVLSSDHVICCMG